MVTEDGEEPKQILRVTKTMFPEIKDSGETTCLMVDYYSRAIIMDHSPSTVVIKARTIGKFTPTDVYCDFLINDSKHEPEEEEHAKNSAMLFASIVNSFL
jgi:hypothetical protein